MEWDIRQGPVSSISCASTGCETDSEMPICGGSVKPRNVAIASLPPQPSISLIKTNVGDWRARGFGFLAHASR